MLTNARMLALQRSLVESDQLVYVEIERRRSRLAEHSGIKPRQEQRIGDLAGVI